MMDVTKHGMTAIKIKNIPMPPSINEAYRGGGNRRFLSKVAREWYKLFLGEMKLHNPGPLCYSKMIVGADFFFRYPKKSDTLNYTKLLWDGLQKAGIIKNDSLFYIECCAKSKVEKDKEPYVNVTIMTLGVAP